MKPFKTMLILVLLTTACTNRGFDKPARLACEIAAPYAGPALRAPVPAAATRARRGAQSGLSAQKRNALGAAYDRTTRATSAASMTAAVWQSGGRPWTASHGATEGRLHYWASVGKIVAAAAIMRLEANGRLSLDDPISDHVNGVPNGDIITLRMLLNHTSGLFSANEDPEVRAREAPLDLAGVLEVLHRQPPYACPGAAWRYSNSGYTLLGAVIETVTGRPYHEAARDLVLSRSSARAIRLLVPGDGLDDIVMPASTAGARAMDIRGPQAAGGVVADAESMAIFLRDVMEGRVLPRETVSRMLAELYPMPQAALSYGLGLMTYDVPGPDGTTLWIGHSGGVPGATTVVAYAPALDAIAAVALTGDGSAEATANLLLGALDQPTAN